MQGGPRKPKYLASAPPASERILVTVEEMAGLLSISRSLAYELVESGDLPHVRIGALVRCSPEAVRAWSAGLHKTDKETA